MFPTGIMGVIGLVSMFLGVMSFRESPTLMKKIIAVIVFMVFTAVCVITEILAWRGVL